MASCGTATIKNNYFTQRIDRQTDRQRDRVYEVNDARVIRLPLDGHFDWSHDAVFDWSHDAVFDWSHDASYWLLKHRKPSDLFM